MKERIVNQIIQGMLSVLSNAQAAHLQKVLAVALGISVSANIGMYLHGQYLQNEIVDSQEEVFDLKARNTLLKDTYNELLGQMQETQNEVQNLQSQVEELQK